MAFSVRMVAVRTGVTVPLSPLVTYKVRPSGVTARRPVPAPRAVLPNGTGLPGRPRSC